MYKINIFHACILKFSILTTYLSWVKEEILNFGGNPENVTLFGESSGAGMTNLLMLSPLSEGLFHKVILQSGVAISSCQLL